MGATERFALALAVSHLALLSRVLAPHGCNRAVRSGACCVSFGSFVSRPRSPWVQQSGSLWRLLCLIWLFGLASSLPMGATERFALALAVPHSDLWLFDLASSLPMGSNRAVRSGACCVSFGSLVSRLRSPWVQQSGSLWRLLYLILICGSLISRPRSPWVQQSGSFWRLLCLIWLFGLASSLPMGATERFALALAVPHSDLWLFDLASSLPMGATERFVLALAVSHLALWSRVLAPHGCNRAGSLWRLLCLIWICASFVSRPRSPWVQQSSSLWRLLPHIVHIAFASLHLPKFVTLAPYSLT
ncbi:hypothetical protein F4604DRAFT_1940321 [Suillus subluteus]|nr:hypothetical protein F4604DRAFT_1940321 [Suillus subluteus]